jgi:predicted tellurium resistance membrane protein TerC
VLALLCTTTVQQQVPVAGLLLGMVFRMGLPLVAGFALHQLFPALAEAGMIGFVLAYYLLTLSVETLLALRVMNSNKPATKAS